MGTELTIRSISNGYLLCDEDDEEEFYSTLEALFQRMFFILEDRTEVAETMQRYGKVTISKVPPPSASCPS